jgi:nucleoside-diphosphate-sugar epimerase
LMALALKAAAQPGVRSPAIKTRRRLGYSPAGLDDGLKATLEWFGAIGRLG